MAGIKANGTDQLKAYLMGEVFQFIDDGAGIFKGSSHQFETWKQSFKQLVSAYKFDIDDKS